MKINKELEVENLLIKKFNSNDLSFKCYSHTPDTQELWTHKTIELYKNNIPVGYIKLMFYDREQAKYPIKDVFDYFAIVKSDVNPQEWTEKKNVDFFNQFNFKEPLSYIKERYTKEYHEFSTLFENKPTVEIVRIYDSNDKKCTNNKEYPSFLEEREPINFKGQGYGKALYLAAAIWMKEEKKSVYSSIKQTEDGQNIWKSIQKNPYFLLSCDTIFRTLNGKPVEINRKSITIKTK